MRKLELVDLPQSSKDTGSPKDWLWQSKDFQDKLKRKRLVFIRGLLYLEFVME